MNRVKPAVLIAPLNWGLGHATRCIPLIHALLEMNCEPVICANDLSAELLKQEFPELRHVQLPTYSISYPKNSRFFGISMLLHLPKFFMSVARDKSFVRKIAKEINPAFIISDNRYGFRHKKIFSVLVTHQVRPVIPGSFRFFEKIIHMKLFRMMKKFRQVWVPDFENEPNLSGKLSHGTGYDGDIKYCGPLSRFQANETSATENRYDLLCIVSGPEPHRTIFENYCLKIAEETTLKLCIIAGKPDEHNSFRLNNLTYYSHSDTSEFRQTIMQSDTILSRAGYSTIMDMFVLEKKSLLVPTPGQTEQEYLANFLSGNGLFHHFDPDKDDLISGLQKLKNQRFAQFTGKHSDVSELIKLAKDL